MRTLTVGILAHVDAGKTTLAEALLYQSGKIRKLGRVDHRNTYLDTHDLERARGITIFSQQATLTSGELEIALLDTPGHVDFSPEAERALPVMDYAILVISGTDGVQAHTETLWALLKRYKIPVFLFITKMDVAGTDRAALMEEFQTRLGESCVDFSADNPSRDESIALLDERALDRYTEEGSLPKEEIARLIRDRKLFPCFFGSGLKLNGIESFLDALEKYTLSPVYPSVFGAKVYKIARDSQDNRLTYLKVTGGSLAVRSPIRYLPLRGTEPLEEKVTQIRLVSGGKYTTADQLNAGQIGAVTGLTQTWPGQGLGMEPDSSEPYLTPAMGYRLVLPKDCDARVLLPKLKQLEEEEPQLHILWQERTGEIHVQLMGAVQIAILKSLIRDRFGAEVEVDSSRVLYRETIAGPVEGVGHFEPLRHYAEVHLLLEPGAPGSGIVLDTVCPEDVLDRNWQRLILTHLEEKEQVGVLTGSPITDMKITLLAGRAHLKHTEGGDFRQATYRAVRQGLMQAESVLLEPYYAFHLSVPAEQIGRAITDVRAMGGTHNSPVPEGVNMLLIGEAPVSAMQDYAAQVASYTSGKGRFSCHVEGYRPCRDQQAVIEAIGYDPTSDLENTPDSVFCAHGAGFTVKWDKVPEYMHLDSGLKKASPPETAAPTVRRQNLNIDDKELEAIMVREFGPIRRKQYASPQINSAVDIQMQKRKTKEHIILDGYNVIFAWDDLKELAAQNLDLARTRLLQMLANYQGYTKCDLVVVFDAYKVPGGQGSRLNEGSIRVAYTREGETADMYIERLVEEIGKNETVRVVTSDRLVQVGVLRSGVLRCSSGEFRTEVDWVLEQIAQAVKKTYF